MDRDEIVELLTELGRRSDRRGLQGEMYVVGGAAVALAFDARRSTRDIDAVFEPKLVIYELAAALADERGLRLRAVAQSPFRPEMVRRG
jgi:Nucleotidyltransferase of unknown function (DUF6036)